MISIITITYNAECFLEKTMLSVLQQSCSDYEYLIIDGKSNDNTINIIRLYEEKIRNGEFQSITSNRFRWVSELDSGLYDAMNKGLALAQGEFVWFINAGDKIYDNTTLSKIVNTLSKNPECDIVYGQSLMIDASDKPLGERHKIAPKNLTKSSLLHGLVVCHQSILVRKNAVSTYNLRYKIAADYDWVCTAVASSRQNCYINDYLSRFMTSGVSSRQRKRALTERFCIMRKHFGLLRTLFAHFLILIRYPFTRKY